MKTVHALAIGIALAVTGDAQAQGYTTTDAQTRASSTPPGIGIETAGG